MTFKEAEKLIEEKYDNEYLKGDLGWYAAMAIFKKYDPNFGTKRVR